MSVFPGSESLDYADNGLRVAGLTCRVTVINRNLIIIAFFPLDPPLPQQWRNIVVKLCLGQVGSHRVAV